MQEIVYSILQWGMILSGVAVVLITGYYIYGSASAADQLFRGGSPAGGMMTPQEFARHVSNMNMLLGWLRIASVILLICTLGRFWAFPETGLGVVVVGAALAFGFPMLLDNLAGPASALPQNLQRVGNPRAVLPGTYQSIGLMMLGAGVVQLLVHGVFRLASSGSRRPKASAESSREAAKVRKQQDQFLGACWKLPFCRDTEKQLCPIRAQKKSCWRTGRGCYCDQNVILTLSGGNQYQASRGSSGYLSAGATVARPKTLREKREQCLACPIYLHHQGQKYRLGAPLVLLGIIGGVALYHTAIQQKYAALMLGLGQATAKFSFQTSASGGDPMAWARDMAAHQGIMWMLLSVVIVLSIAYLIQGLEWVLFRLGL
ncbi:MAG: hypothetical protein ACK47B_19690 [Armatimonadota bacterium]